MALLLRRRRRRRLLLLILILFLILVHLGDAATFRREKQLPSGRFCRSRSGERYFGRKEIPAAGSSRTSFCSVGIVRDCSLPCRHSDKVYSKIRRIHTSKFGGRKAKFQL